MKEVETYYKDRIKTGEWGKLNEDEERIIALRAELAAAKTSTKRDTRRRGDRTTRDNERKERWRTKAPKPNEPNTKRMSVNGTENTYHWCSNHKMWTVHKPSECKLKSYEFTLRNERQRRRTRRRPTRQRARGRRGKRELQPLLTPRPERSIYRALQATLSSTLRRFTRTNRQQLPGNNMPFHPSNAIDNHP